MSSAEVSAANSIRSLPPRPWLGLGLRLRLGLTLTLTLTPNPNPNPNPNPHLVLLPGVHDGAVVDGDDVHLVDPSLLKLALDLGFLEARDLARGSGGREGTRERHPENLALVEIARPGPREGGR